MDLIEVAAGSQYGVDGPVAAAAGGGHLDDGTPGRARGRYTGVRVGAGGELGAGGALVATDNLNDAIIRGGAEGIKSRPIIPVLRVLFQDLRPVDRSDAGFLVGDEIIKKLWVVR